MRKRLFVFAGRSTMSVGHPRPDVEKGNATGWVAVGQPATIEAQGTPHCHKF